MIGTHLGHLVNALAPYLSLATLRLHLQPRHHRASPEDMHAEVIAASRLKRAGPSTAALHVSERDIDVTTVVY